jgi:hypothetical protein
MYHPLRNPFMIEVGDLFSALEVLQQRWPSLTDSERVVGMVDSNALLGGELSALKIHPYSIKLFLLHVGRLTFTILGGHAKPP